MDSNFLSQEEAVTWASLNKRMEDRIHNILHNMCVIAKGRSYEGDIDSFRIEDGRVHVTTLEYWCGSREHEYFDFPISYLADDNWHEQYALDVISAREKAEQERLAKVAETHRQAEEKERQEFERLKAKFGDIYGERLDGGIPNA